VLTMDVVKSSAIEVRDSTPMKFDPRSPAGWVWRWGLPRASRNVDGIVDIWWMRRSGSRRR